MPISKAQKNTIAPRHMKNKLQRQGAAKIAYEQKVAKKIGNLGNEDPQKAREGS